MKQINRIFFLEYLLKISNTQSFSQETFSGKNIYFLQLENDTTKLKLEVFQIEFIPQSKRYFFTILIHGIYNSADFLHDDVCNYIKSLNLKRNIIIRTELKETLV